MDSLLATLSAETLRFVEDQLSNNEVASDDELLNAFIEEGLSEVQARQALTYRDQYLLHIYKDGSTPIRQGAQALRFDPRSRRFEPG